MRGVSTAIGSIEPIKLKLNLHPPFYTFFFAHVQFLEITLTATRFEKNDLGILATKGALN